MKKLYSFFLLLISLQLLNAQPAYIRGDFGAGWNDYELIDRGIVKGITISATASNTAAGFVFTRDLSYNPKWCGSTTNYERALNQKLSDASYYFTTGTWDNNLTIPIAIGKYYTIITSENSVSNNDISILETDFNPVDIVNVAQTPTLVTASSDVTVNVALSGTKDAIEKIFLRWSNDNWATSTFTEITSFDGSNIGSAIIPGQNAGIIVSYYAFSTLQATPLAADIDFFTLKINNHANMNYSYVVSQTSGCPIVVTLGNDTSICGFGSLILDPGITISPYGDSLIITYNATQGQAELAGVSKVYMHAGAELHTNGGWQYTIGNWGIDDGVGEMSNIGSNQWRKTINPVTYFGYPADSVLNGILLVFRNEDGSLIGKDDNGNDIWIDMKLSPPVSSFSGVVPTFLPNPVDSIIWSDGSHGTFLPVSASGEYWVKVFNTTGGCEASDTVNVTIGSIPYVNIGNDQGHCYGENVTLDAGNFTSYNWSTGATTQQITVDTTGIYSVTVTNSSSCTGFDFVNITFADTPVANFSYQANGLNVTFFDLSENAVNYAWYFTGGSTPQSNVVGDVSWNYLLQGQYNVRLTVSNACTSSTYQETIFVTVGMQESNMNESIAMYPTITSDKVFIQISKENIQNIFISLSDISGKEILRKKNINEEILELDISTFTPGIYFLKISDGSLNTVKKIIKIN